MSRLELLILFSMVIHLSNELPQCHTGAHTCKYDRKAKKYTCTDNSGKGCICKHEEDYLTDNDLAHCEECTGSQKWYPLHKKCISSLCKADDHHCFPVIDSKIVRCRLKLSPFTLCACRDGHSVKRLPPGNKSKCAACLKDEVWDKRTGRCNS